jgi:hypothetical protein
MKNLLTSIRALISGTAAAPDFAATPESLVRQYFVDFKKWNDRASARSDTDRSMDRAEADYAKLLRKFCLPGFKGKPIAYGSESSHSPDGESIVSSKLLKTTAIVNTQSKSPSHGFLSDYEYHLSYQSGRWYLVEVYYVDPDGKYPGL